jgi:hypothetical protein
MVDIVFSDCHKIYTTYLNDAERLKYLDNPSVYCQNIKSEAFKYVLFWGLVSGELVVDLPILIYVIRRISVPFLTRKPIALFVLLRHSGQLVFKKIPDGQKFVEYNKHMYVITNTNLKDKYQNTWHIFREGNNREIINQVIDPTLITSVFFHGRLKKNISLKRIPFFLRFTKEHLMKYWEVRIMQDKVILVSHKKVEDPNKFEHYYNGKKFNIEILAKTESDVSFYEEDDSGGLLFEQDVKNKIKTVYVSAKLIPLDDSKHFSSEILYNAYVYSRKTTDFAKRLSGSMIQNNKLLFIIIAIVAGIFIFYLLSPFQIHL